MPRGSLADLSSAPPQSFAAGLSNAVRPTPTLSTITRAPSGAIAPGPAEPGFFTNIGDKLSAGFEKALDPENLAEKGLDVAGRLALDQAAGYFADDIPVNPGEEARLASLTKQQAEQERLQREKEKIATGFLSQARGISGTGQDESNAAKIAAARAGQSYIRGGSQTPASIAAKQRRINLAAARSGGTAQRQGAAEAAIRRDALFTSAANTLPTGAPLVKSARLDLKESNERFLAEQTALGKQQKNFSDIFGGLLPTGEDSAEERKKRSEGVGP